jgi:hypothetical protein
MKLKSHTIHIYYIYGIIHIYRNTYKENHQHDISFMHIN